VYVLRNSLRRILSFPYGIAIREEPPKSIELLKSLVEDFNFDYVFSVGDVVTSNMLKYGLVPDLAVVDSKTRRRLSVAGLDLLKFDVVVYVRNSAGTITQESLRAIEDCVRLVKWGKRAVIVVDGEEDLLALPIIASSPEKTLVVYGLYTGFLIAVPADGYKNVVARILEMMK